MDAHQISDRAGQLASDAEMLANNLRGLAADAGQMVQQAGEATGLSPTVGALAVFVLACFVGYYVVWRVTPALHSPLMAVTNAVSSVIIVGALIAAGPAGIGFAKAMGFLAVILASINIFGGFIVTHRMLQMFKKKTR
ncbi:NAD(P) transhydrogenase subunit alpha [Stella sp.]|uniref:NAD(P) transhydrogenase subunit alpha n=1 Tax=Stella sp. TaxID=2912054 RepID=UPI0035B489F8